MIAQPARRADHDMGALRQLAALAARVHAADAGDDARARIVVQPAQFALHLQRQFARGRDDQRQRIARRAHRLRAVQQGVGQRQAEGDGLARAGLGGNQQVAPLRLLGHHRHLHGGGVFVIALGKGAGQGGMGGGERQTGAFRADFAPSLSLPAEKDSKTPIQRFIPPMRANIWRSLLSRISRLSPEIVAKPRPPGMPVSGSGSILE